MYRRNWQHLTVYAHTIARNLHVAPLQDVSMTTDITCYKWTYIYMHSRQEKKEGVYRRNDNVKMNV